MARNLRERFGQPLDEFVRGFVASVRDDAALVPHDVDGSMAHVKMLVDCGLLTADEGKHLLAGLEQVKAEWAAGSFPLRDELEDVHMNVEARLKEIAGPVADKLHTGRSRNDQVALDLRLFVREECNGIAQELSTLSRLLESRGTDDLLPGTTHLQRAQPVTLRTLMHAWAVALRRDIARLADAKKRTNVSPLGAGALAGTTLPIDPRKSAQWLGFPAVFENPVDAVSDRDFAMEFAFACAVTLTHLSQWAATWILWMTPEFGFLRLPDALTTGSSLMPQKKNPDVLELIRAKAGQGVGAVANLLTIGHGLPPAYNRDLQETKPPVLALAKTTRDCLEAARRCVEAAEFRVDRMAQAAADPSLRATALAEHLVKKGVAFREAHAAVGRLFRRVEETGSLPADATDIHPLLDKDALSVLGRGS